MRSETRSPKIIDKFQSPAPPDGSNITDGEKAVAVREFDINVRRAVADDIDSVAEIESGSLSLWKRDFFAQELSIEHSIFLVAEIDGAVAGYMVARRAFDEVELFSIAVSRDHRREGVGTLLIEHLRKYIGGAPCFLEVRDGNETARSFYRRMGFRDSGRRKRYYDEEDAVLMVLDES